jgi:hypothetical protein
VRRVLNHKSREKMAAFDSARQEVETIRRGKRNVGRQKGGFVDTRPAANEGSGADVHAINAISPKYSEEDRDYLSLKFADPRLARLL